MRMEQNPPILAKKVWSLMRVIFFMLKKNISKTKLFSDLNNMLTKRSKIAGKSLHNLLFHHHHHHHHTAINRHPHHLPFPTPPPSDDEFSCTTTPQHPLISISPTHKKHHQTHAPKSVAQKSHALPCIDDIVEMLTISAAAESPAYAKSPVGKELRITDSPFPSSDGDGQVDEEADRFIMRFYNSLRRED